MSRGRRNATAAALAMTLAQWSRHGRRSASTLPEGNLAESPARQEDLKRLALLKRARRAGRPQGRTG